MKVALVANSTWNIINFRIPIIEALLHAGHHIIVIAPPDQYIGQLRTIPNLEYESLDYLDRKSTDFVSNLRLLSEFHRIYKVKAPDLIIHFTVKPNVFGNLAARYIGIPSICVVTGLGYSFLHNGLAQEAARRLYRFSFLRASEVIFENERDLELFRKLKFLPKGKGLSVKGCGVDITHFSPAPKPDYIKGKTVFTFIGRLLVDKGINEFVEAAQIVHAKYPDTVFRIVGNLDEDNPAHISKNRLAGWVRMSGIEYMGFRDDPRQLYIETDWVVLPSYREGMSRVLLEALAMGRPIITTDTPGCSETVQPGKNGFLVQVKDAKSLTLACETAVNMSHQEWLSFGKQSRRKAILEFERSIIGDFYVKTIQQVMAAKSQTIAKSAKHQKMNKHG